jgi:2-iminobutanoate/2-iminopropanoate deaminase
MPRVETSTPAGTPTPIGPYSHIARVDRSITIGGTAGVDPDTNQLAGRDVAAQTRRIIETFRVMLASEESDLDHVVHVNVYLRSMADFEAMNAAYADGFGGHRPARTVIGVADLPKPGVLVTMSLTAVVADRPAIRPTSVADIPVSRP